MKSGMKQPIPLLQSQKFLKLLKLAFELSDLGHGVEFLPISISWLLWAIFWPFLQLAIEMSNFGIFWAPGGRGHCVPGGI